MRPGTLTTALALAAGGVVLHVSQAWAQRWQVDLAGNRVAYDSSGGIGSLSVAPLVEWNRGMAYATFSGAVAGFEAGEWASHGRGDLSLLFLPVRSLRRLRAELVGSADGSVHSTGYRTAGTRGEFRLHFSSKSVGAWVGGSVATGWTREAAGLATALGPSAGVWGRGRSWSATAVWSPYRLAGAWYQQVEGRVFASTGPVDLMGYVGWRGARSVPGLTSAGWGGGSMTVWLARTVGLVVSGGSYASDLLQALPKGRYLSAGVKLSRGRPSLWAGTTGAHALYAHDRGELELRFAVPGASRVDLVADWTSWQPVPMLRAADGRWVLRVILAPGVHRFNLVVDGVRWIVPQGIASVDDGFGGRTSLLVVP